MEPRRILTRFRWHPNRRRGLWPLPVVCFYCDGAPDNMRVRLLFLWGLVAASTGGAATLQEDFFSDPLQNSWKTFGETNLFRWDSTNQNLDVTWNSYQTNSFYCHSLGTIVSKSDDFSLSFDLQLSDINLGVTSGKTNAFELVVGFINLISATNTNLERGIGVNATYGARNTFEFDYFPR